MPRLLADLTPLRENPAYRRLWSGLALSSIGTQLTTVAVSLEIYAITKSTFAVGLLGVFALVPLVISGLYGGSVVDAHDRRKVAIYASLVLWAVTIGIAAQAWLGVGNVWVLYCLVAVQNAAAGLNQPARSAIIPRLVRKEMLPAANALGSIIFSVAMTVGPMLAGGLVASVGYGATYTIDALTFSFALWALIKLPPIPPEGEVHKAGLKSVVQGFAFLSTRPNIRMTFLSDMCAMIFAQPRALLPAVGEAVLGGNGTTVGFLLASTALGSMGAALFSGPLGRVRRQGMVVVNCVALWGMAVAGFGVVIIIAHRAGPNPSHMFIWLAAACLLVSGGVDSISMVFRNTILQAATPDAMRGRLQGIFIVVVAGGPRMGDVVAGAGGSLLGEGLEAFAGGLACVLAVFILSKLQPAFRRYDSRFPQP